MSDASTVPYALAVDDDELVLMVIEDMLEEAGFRTLTAGDVDAALEKLSAHKDAVTVVFTDVEMPGDRNGFDLARLVAEEYPDIVTIVASGRHSPQGNDLPPNAKFIGKPFTAETVYGCLKELLPDGRKPEPLKRAL